jgi:hypothetical protein
MTTESQKVRAAPIHAESEMEFLANLLSPKMSVIKPNLKPPPRRVSIDFLPLAMIVTVYNTCIYIKKSYAKGWVREDKGTFLLL